MENSVATGVEKSVEKLTDGRATRAIGIGLCDATVVLSTVKQTELDRDLSILNAQARRGIVDARPAEIIT